MEKNGAEETTKLPLTTSARTGSLTKRLPYLLQTRSFLEADTDADRFRDQPTFTVYVGKDRAKFNIHKALLCEVSPYFEAACNGRFKEAHEGSMELPEDDVDAFENFVQWMYGTPVSTEILFINIVEIFALAEKLCVTRLKNDVVDALIHKIHTEHVAPGIENIAYLYDHVPRGSPIRKMMVDCYTWYISFDYYQKEEVYDKFVAVPEFVTDLVINMSKRIKSGAIENPFTVEKTSYYHEHTVEVRCKTAEKDPSKDSTQ